MSDLLYTPGPATGAQIEKSEGPMWALILVRELRHSPEKVWKAITDPDHLRHWAPYETNASLGALGTVKLTWVGAQGPQDIVVTKADAPRVLEYNDTKWVLEAVGTGTKLTLWANIDKRYIAMGAAGWHISLDVLDHHLAGKVIPRIAGPEAMKFEGWQRLHAEYAKQFGVAMPQW